MSSNHAELAARIASMIPGATTHPDPIFGVRVRIGTRYVCRVARNGEVWALRTNDFSVPMHGTAEDIAEQCVALADS